MQTEKRKVSRGMWLATVIVLGLCWVVARANRPLDFSSVGVNCPECARINEEFGNKARIQRGERAAMRTLLENTVSRRPYAGNYRPRIEGYADHDIR